MEAIACRDGLNLARRVGVQKVMLETDCLELINLWFKRDTQRSIIDPLLKEIDAIRLAFQEFSFCYINRSCNKVAHILAKQVSDTHRLEMWYVTPECVSDLVMSEASTG
jgi:hypothetical protein